MDQIVVRTGKVRGCVCAKPCPITKHHRKPRSIGGGWAQHNMIALPKCLHQYWHTVFYNLSAEQIAWRITCGKLMQGQVVALSINRYVGETIHKGIAIERGLLPHYKATPFISDKAWEAWYSLFGNFNSEIDIIKEINKRFLDPYYNLVMVI